MSTPNLHITVVDMDEYCRVFSQINSVNALSQVPHNQRCDLMKSVGSSHGSDAPRNHVGIASFLFSAPLAVSTVSFQYQTRTVVWFVFNLESLRCCYHLNNFTLVAATITCTYPLLYICINSNCAAAMIGESVVLSRFVTFLWVHGQCCYGDRM